jgi:C4-type Zn-finger protein
MHHPAALTCPQCQIGVLQPTATTYSGIHHGMLISVPNMPSYMCDICEYHEFEVSALIQIEALVGQLSLPTEVARRSANRTHIESDIPTAPRRFKP